MMRVPADHILAITHALRRAETAEAAVRALHGRRCRAALDGLVELLYAPPSARAALAAIGAVESWEEPALTAALEQALGSPHASVRLAAVQALHRRQAWPAHVAVVRRLQQDSSWPVRRAALLFLVDQPGPLRWQLLGAATDPHWRVRHALVKALLAWAQGGVCRAAIQQHLADLGPGPRVEGVRAYLAHCWSVSVPVEECSAQPADVRCLFWDSDAAVLARNLKSLSEPATRAALDFMPGLLAHDDERVRAQALAALRRWGEPRHLAAVVELLGEPRRDAWETITRLLAQLDLDRTEAVVRHILGQVDAAPLQIAWAQQQQEVLRADGLLVVGRRAATPEQVQVPATPPSHLRAAALTPAQACELVQEPTRETSWHVLAQAARIARTPLWELAPEPPWQPAATTQEPAPPLQPRTTVVAGPRLLGATPVSSLAVSGAYALPVEGFVRAMEAGVNLFFWEPGYHGLTEFMKRLAPGARAYLQIMAGTFEADGRGVQRDVERALRLLQIDRVAVFLLFWVRSWSRVTPDVSAALQRLQEEGKIGMAGLSTHSRPLALEALERGWGPIMVRHSAAHRGAEDAVLPAAGAAGASIIAFNSTCYARLLQPHGADVTPTAADCYRYTLAQPAVKVCLTAPATLGELEENLAALRDPALPPDRLRALLAHGERVYREDAIFKRLIRDR